MSVGGAGGRSEASGEEHFNTGTRHRTSVRDEESKG